MLIDAPWGGQGAPTPAARRSRRKGKRHWTLPRPHRPGKKKEPRARTILPSLLSLRAHGAYLQRGRDPAGPIHGWWLARAGGLSGRRPGGARCKASCSIEPLQTQPAARASSAKGNRFYARMFRTKPNKGWGRLARPSSRDPSANLSRTIAPLHLDDFRHGRREVKVLGKRPPPAGGAGSGPASLGTPTTFTPSLGAPWSM